METTTSTKSPKRPTEAFRAESLFEVGLGQVIVSRFRGHGLVEIGVFLLDVYCLGVKNAYFTQGNISDYDSVTVPRIFRESPPVAMTPACARKLIEDAVRYAQDLGFAPHPDYKKACRVLGGIRPEECTEQFTFGQEGKPLFVQGPHDSPERCRQIMAQLERRCGRDQYHFLLAANDSDKFKEFFSEQE